VEGEERGGGGKEESQQNVIEIQMQHSNSNSKRMYAHIF